jgi:ribosomal protein L37AE/L43A
MHRRELFRTLIGALIGAPLAAKLFPAKALSAIDTFTGISSRFVQSYNPYADLKFHPDAFSMVMDGLEPCPHCKNRNTVTLTRGIWSCSACGIDWMYGRA